ncbi:MAG: FHA domain-containing protein [Polyangiaceae bacterium]|nr:FHA domain-containing protein [Polyangiaceae bacterium]
MDDEGKRTELPLARGEYAIGRAEENTVRLTDRNISRRHMILRRSGDQGWAVEDLKSYNGCFVNGSRVAATHVMSHGDLLQLGDYRLELSDERRAAAETATSADRARPPLASTLLDRPDRLVVVDGVAAGTEFPLEGERILIGRAEEADISINHSSVSRTHAEIVGLGAGVYEIFDRGSSNGVRVNGMKLERRVIEDDDEIELGDVRLRFVARGRIFRPGAPPRSLSHYASATTSAANPVPRRGGLGLMVAAGAALGILVVIAFVAFGTTDDSQRAGSSERAAVDQTILEQARQLLENGHVDGAHAKLGELPEGSPLRDSVLVRDMEGKWADEVFAQAATERDGNTRRDLVEQIAAAHMVDAERRNRATNLLHEMEKGGTDIGALPVARPPAADVEAASKQTAVLPTSLPPDPPESESRPASAKPASAKPTPAKTVSDTSPDSTETASTSTGRTAITPAPSSTKATGDKAREAILNEENGESTARRMLEPRVWSGRATVDEIKLLRAICRQHRDSVCVSRCTALLREKQP